MATKKIRLDALLNLSEPEFLDLIGGIYENTPTIVQQFYDNHLHPERVSATSGRITNVKLLFDEIRRYVYEGLNGEERLGLLRAHPDLCAALLKKKKECQPQQQRPNRRKPIRATTLWPIFAHTRGASKIYSSQRTIQIQIQYTLHPRCTQCDEIHSAIGNGTSSAFQLRN